MSVASDGGAPDGMTGSRLALALAALAVPTARSGSVCFPAPYIESCLTWRVTGANLTLTATFSTPSNGFVWGAWGLTGLACGSMFPANVWLALPTPGGGVRIEDRVTLGHVAPVCAAGAPQLSHTLASSVGADGSFNVTWTRPLAPAPQYAQPTIAPGSVPLIGAYADGAAALPFPPCGVTGLPFHTNVVGTTVNFFAKEEVAGASAEAAANAGVALAPPNPTAARYFGLMSVWSVCGDSCAALSHVAPATGSVTFLPSRASPSLFPLLTALDGASRTLHVLAYDNSPRGGGGGNLFLAALSADTGALLRTCATVLPVPNDFVYANLGLAFDAASGEVLVAGCTDSACVGPANVTAVAPASCAARAVASIAAAELEVGGGSAFDPRARVFAFTLATASAAQDLALYALNVESGAVTRVAAEDGGTPWIQSLAYDAASRLMFGLAFTTAAYSQPTLVTFNARTGALRSVGAVTGCAGALPNVLALSADGALAYFAGTQGGDGTILFAVHTENATVASAKPLQYAASIADAPVAFVWLP